MDPNDSGQRRSRPGTARPSSSSPCHNCAGVPQVLQSIFGAVVILKTTLRGESVGRSLDQYTRKVCIF